MLTRQHDTRRSRAFGATVASGLLLTMLAACGGADEPAPGASSSTVASRINAAADPASVKGTITLMRNPAEITAATIAEFNKKFPNVKVEPIDYDAVKLKSLLAAGTPPDLFRAEAPQVGALVGQNLLEDLTVPLQTIGITDDKTFDAAKLYVFDGKRYGLPFDWSPDSTIYVNNKLFKKAGVQVPDPSKPLSWAEVADLARKLTVKSGAKTTQFGLGGAWDTFPPARFVQIRLAEAGEKLYGDDQKSINLAGNPKAVEALKFMADLAKEGVTHSPANPSASWSGEEFTKGQIAMVTYGYWYNRLLNDGKSAAGTDYTMLPAPYWSDPAKRVDPTITGTGMVMSSKTKDPQAAWAFYSWYLTGDRAQNNAKTGSGFPVVQADAQLLPQEKANDKQAYEVASSEAKVAPAMQFNRYYDDAVFTNSYNKNLQKYIAGSITIDDMAKAVETDVKAAIDDGVEQQGK
ncbi:MAG TPA: sugar ABC transporter substrate-binding protein [Kineosporiaceae bacterium]|jgi:multiple sugar transport system substrate-binding protein|nr:sugar ABC transporter substrate-binding protein [Kineosporiaceae bacterium]